MLYFIVVDRDKFTVDIWKSNPLGYKWRRIHSFTCAVGTDGYTTPVGLYKITKKESPPTWTPPDEDWVGPALRGPDGKPKKLSADDPNNPLAGAFIWISDHMAVGLHGTKNIGSLGSKASHGCIRLHPDHARYIYKTVPKGSIVVIL